MNSDVLPAYHIFAALKFQDNRNTLLQKCMGCHMFETFVVPSCIEGPKIQWAPLGIDYASDLQTAYYIFGGPEVLGQLIHPHNNTILESRPAKKHGKIFEVLFIYFFKWRKENKSVFFSQNIFFTQGLDLPQNTFGYSLSIGIPHVRLFCCLITGHINYTSDFLTITFLETLKLQNNLSTLKITIFVKADTPS